MTIPLTRPFYGQEEIDAATRVLRSGQLVQAEEVEKFEYMVADYVGVKYAVATSSGTTALHLALLAAGVTSGTKVLVPAFTFVATANAVLMCGAKPVLQDIGFGTFNAFCAYDPHHQDEAHLALVVHAFGHPVQTENCHLPLIEDAAAALGSEYKGKKCGSLGLAGCFSFHATKVVTTGEGGMVVTDSHDVAFLVRLLRDQKHAACYNMLGYNYRMTEVQGAIGQEQMKKLPEILRRRAEVAARYDEELYGLPAGRPAKNGNYQSYVLLLNLGIDREKVIGGLAKYGIESAEGTNYLGEYRHLNPEGHCFFNSIHAARRTLRIPIYPQMTEQEQETVIKALRKVLI